MQRPYAVDGRAATGKFVRPGWGAVATALALVGFMTSVGRAQTVYTWTGGAGNGVWQTSSSQTNWAGGVYTPGNGTNIGVVFTGTPFAGPTTITLEGGHNPNMTSMVINGSAGSTLTFVVTNTAANTKLDFQGGGETLTVESGASGSRITGTAAGTAGFVNLQTSNTNQWAINGTSTVFTIDAEIRASTDARFIDKRGTGTLVFNGSNSFGGGTILTTGTLQFGNVFALGTGTGTPSTVRFAGGSLRAGVSGTVPTNPFSIDTGVTGTFDTQGNSVVLARSTGLLSGDATTNLVKIGSGTLAFGGTSSLTGTLTVNAGTLWVQGITADLSGDLAATSIVVNNGGTFQFGNASTGDPNLADTTYLTLNSGGMAVWQEGESLGGVNLAGGALDLQRGNITARGATALAWTSGTITNTQTNGTYTFELQSPVDKTTAGIVSISGSASVTGTAALRILDGEIFLTGSANLGTAPITLGGGGTTGTFAYGGVTATRSGVLTSQGLGGTIRVDSAAAVLTLSGTLAGSGPLVKAGAGTLAVTGSSTYTGTASVSAGRLLVDGSLLGATSVRVLSACTLGGSGTIGGSVAVLGGTLSPGSTSGPLSIGSLALDAASFTMMEIAGTGQYDQVILAGSLAYGGGLTLDFAQTFADNTTFALFKDFNSVSGNLASVTSVGAAYNGVTFTRAGEVWTSTQSGGQSLQFNQTTGELLVVPEPVSLAVLGVAGFGLLIVARRGRPPQTLAAEAADRRWTAAYTTNRVAVRPAATAGR